MDGIICSYNYSSLKEKYVDFLLYGNYVDFSKVNVKSF